VYISGQYSRETVSQLGVPQGSILGPLLFSIFINDLPLHITHPLVTCSLFADDGTLDVQSSDASVIQESLQQSLNEVSAWCSNNLMVPNPDKTKCMQIATRQKLQLKPPTLQLTFNSHPVGQVQEQRVLGITIDETLSWKPHISKLCKTLSRNLFLLSKLKSFTEESTRKMFYHAHIQPHLDYASVVWDGASDANFKELNTLHRRAAKLIFDKSKYAINTDDKIRQLEMLPLSEHMKINKLMFVHKALCGRVPGYISALFQQSNRPKRMQREKLLIPKPRLDIFKTSFSYSGAKLWNDLLPDIASSCSSQTFRNRLVISLLQNKKIFANN